MSEWIDADNELPEEGKEVLICFEYPRMAKEKLYGISWQWHGLWFFNNCIGMEKIDHLVWMPLPDPPKNF